MNPADETRKPSEEDLFDCLEHPERWPEDPGQQAELAALLELHLALEAHGRDLSSVQPLRRPRLTQAPWFLAAAALVIALGPALFATYRIRHLQALARDRDRIEQVAQRRGQARLWADFFQQSTTLIQAFENAPQACQRDREDHQNQLLAAQNLLEASHQLAAQGAPNPEAEAIRTRLHTWLTELSLEDSCMDPARAQELRQQAKARNLEDEAQRLGALLVREGS